MIEDITGREVKVGDRIAYPVRARADMWLQTARVESIVETERGMEIHARNPQARAVVIKGVHRIVLLPPNTPR